MKVYAATGDVITGANASPAMQMVSRFEPAHASRVRYDTLLEHSGQWTLSSASAAQFRGELFLTATDPDASPGHAAVWLKRPAAGAFTTFDHGLMIDVARDAMPSDAITNAVWLHEYERVWGRLVVPKSSRFLPQSPQPLHPEVDAGTQRHAISG